MPTNPRGNLPPISFAVKSETDVKAEIITGYEQITGRSLAQGDPVRLFLLSVAAVIIQQRNIIDYSAKQNLLSYADGEYIDYIGEFLSVFRQPAQAALTTIRFTLSAAQSGVYIIPAGTRVAGGGLEFHTLTPLEISAGQLTGETTAACTTKGAIGNGLLPGQIRVPVRPLPFVASAQNITESSGGSDKEGDESLVDRIRLAPSSFSVAGPVGAYEFWALTASPAIIDVAVYSPSPGVVDVRPLLENGAIPGQEILDQVDAVLSADDVRPLTDQVLVNAPEAVSYDVRVDYWVKSSDAAQAQVIQQRVDSAVKNYVLWQKSKIGRDINPDQLLMRIINAGAKRADIISPSFTILSDIQVASDNLIDVNYQGLEDA